IPGRRIRHAMRARDRHALCVDGSQDFIKCRAARVRAVGVRVRNALSIRAARVRTVEVPMRRPLAVSTGQVTIAPMVLLDLYTNDGPVGCSYVFAVQRWALAPLAQL